MLTRLLMPLLVLALAFGAVACGDDEEADGGGGGSASSEQGSDPVQFTFIADQAGPGGLYGTNVLEGARFAVDRINADGGVNGHQLEMEVVDSASDQGQATAAMTKAARGENDA